MIYTIKALKEQVSSDENIILICQILKIFDNSRFGDDGINLGGSLVFSASTMKPSEFEIIVCDSRFLDAKNRAIAISKFIQNKSWLTTLVRTEGTVDKNN